MEYIPIACCNVLYNKMKEVLMPSLIAKKQGAFVHERFIVIISCMVYQDLARHHGRKNSKHSLLIKLDMKKAYDTID